MLCLCLNPKVVSIPSKPEIDDAQPLFTEKQIYMAESRTLQCDTVQH